MIKIKSNLNRYDGNERSAMSVVTKSKIKKKFKAESLYKYWMVYLIWMVYYFTYFGLQYSMFSIRSDIVWLNFSLFGFVELTGMYFASSVSKRMRRVLIMRVFLIIASLACLLNMISNRIPSVNISLFISKVKSSQILYKLVFWSANRIHS